MANPRPSCDDQHSADQLKGEERRDSNESVPAQQRSALQSPVFSSLPSSQASSLSSFGSGQFLFLLYIILKSYMFIYLSILSLQNILNLIYKAILFIKQYIIQIYYYEFRISSVSFEHY